MYKKWLFAHGVVAIAAAGSAAIASRFKAAIDRMAQAGYPAQLARAASLAASPCRVPG